MTHVGKFRLDALIRKLSVQGGLTGNDRQTLDGLHASTRQVAAGRDIIAQGDEPNDVHLVVEGFACRYKVLPDGSRQIVAVLVPGDFCDLHVAILGEMDHAIGAISACTLVEIPRETVLDLTEHHPRIARALWWATLVDEGTLREWIANIGQREAAERLTHLFCELLVRLQVVGLADANSYPMPLRQSDLADVLGMTSVHVNRTLQTLREAGLIVLERRRLTIPDVERLKAYCSFDPAYLHLEPRRSERVE